MENEYKGRLGCFGRLEERHKSRLSNILALISNLPFAAIPCYWWETDQVREENGLVWGMQILTGTHHTRKNNSFKTPWISKNKGNKKQAVFTFMCECLQRSIRHVAGNADTHANGKTTGFRARNTKRSKRQPCRHRGNSLTTGCHGDLPGRSMGWGAGDGSVYGHRIANTARSARHVARHLWAARGKIDGANN